MNFFEQQHQAQNNSRKLIAFFSLAILSLIAITTAFIAVFLEYSGTSTLARSTYHHSTNHQGLNTLTDNLSWELLIGVAICIITLVTLGCLYKIIQLRQGGESIAMALGGKPVHPDSSAPHERKLLNVVEEMAIASGTPVPSVYLLEESAINAFAAGHNVHDAVIGVTRGCIEQLDRDQLQGVIAHEFSHILHGDMRINLHLIGALHGILLIGLLGSMLTRSGSRRYSHQTSSRRNNSSGIVLLGWGLIIIGYSGTFFGKLIKSAISRQREFLADASAVQYTRNPQGISEALQKIGGFAYGSQLLHPRAEQFSHMYFGEGSRSTFDSLMATHPPLEVRIKRITPSWNGTFPKLTSGTPILDTDDHHQGYSRVSGEAANGFEKDVYPESSNSNHSDIIDSIASPTSVHLNQAKDIISRIPASLRKAAKDPFTSRAIIYNLLIHSDERAAAQWQQLQSRAHPVVYKIAIQMKSDLEKLPPEHKLPLFELTVPALKRLSKPQYQVFKSNIIALIKADRKVNIFEWALYRILLNAMEAEISLFNSTSSIRQVGVPIQQLLSTISHAGHQRHCEAEHAYNRGMQELKLANLPLLNQQQTSLPMLDSAIEQLRSLRPLQKPALLKALIQCIQHDGQITTQEFELFRAIADSLDCPVPPLITK